MNFLAVGLETELSLTFLLLHKHPYQCILRHSARYGDYAAETFNNNSVVDDSFLARNSQKELKTWGTRLFFLILYLSPY